MEAAASSPVGGIPKSPLGPELGHLLSQSPGSNRKLARSASLTEISNIAPNEEAGRINSASAPLVDRKDKPSKEFAEQEVGVAQITEDFEKRGTIEDVQGVCYHCKEDIEMVYEENPDVTFVGVSYQIASVSVIDSVAETFKMVIDISIVFPIADADHEGYTEYKNKGSITFQEIVDEGKVTVQPPVFEVRNAVSAPEIYSERISGLQLCWNHRKERWAWYVSLYCQMRLECWEEFEMRTFPFTRNALQVQLQAKAPVKSLMLVPYNSRSALPHYFWDEGKQDIAHCFLRGNSYKTDKTPGNWVMENHHLAIVPIELLAPQPSGNQFGLCLISVQVKQKSKFYLWNTVPVVFWLPVLSGLAIVQDPGSIADRMGIVLTLLLTMSTYKVSLAEWIPQKDYLTWMDWYIMAGFSVILGIGLMVGFSKWRTGGMEDGEAATTVLWPEIIFVGILEFLWIVPHLALFFSHYFYTSWPNILKNEKESLREICDKVTKEREKMDEAEWLTCEPPNPPVKDSE